MADWAEFQSKNFDFKLKYDPNERDQKGTFAPGLGKLYSTGDEVPLDKLIMQVDLSDDAEKTDPTIGFNNYYKPYPDYTDPIHWYVPEEKAWPVIWSTCAFDLEKETIKDCYGAYTAEDKDAGVNSKYVVSRSTNSAFQYLVQDPTASSPSLQYKNKNLDGDYTYGINTFNKEIYNELKNSTIHLPLGTVIADYQKTEIATYTTDKIQYKQGNETKNITGVIPGFNLSTCLVDGSGVYMQYYKEEGGEEEKFLPERAGFPITLSCSQKKWPSGDDKQTYFEVISRSTELILRIYNGNPNAHGTSLLKTKTWTANDFPSKVIPMRFLIILGGPGGNGGDGSTDKCGSGGGSGGLWSVYFELQSKQEGSNTFAVNIGHAQNSYYDTYHDSFLSITCYNSGDKNGHKLVFNAGAGKNGTNTSSGSTSSIPGGAGGTLSATEKVGAIDLKNWTYELYDGETGKLNSELYTHWGILNLDYSLGVAGGRAHDSTSAERIGKVSLPLINDCGMMTFYKKGVRQEFYNTTEEREIVDTDVGTGSGASSCISSELFGSGAGKAGFKTSTSSGDGSGSDAIFASCGGGGGQKGDSTINHEGGKGANGLIYIFC